MATSVYTKYTAGVESLLEGTNSGTDVWKVALAATINLADTTFVVGTTDLATAGGYTAGGNTCTTLHLHRPLDYLSWCLLVLQHGQLQVRVLPIVMQSCITQH